MNLHSVPLRAFGSTVTVDELLQARRTLHLEHRRDGQLWATDGEMAQAVVVHCCFPWSAPGRFISLRTLERDEVALIRRPDQLDDTSREHLERAIVAAGFAFRITGIRHVEDEVEIRQWEVDTAQGRRSFQTGRDRWPRELPGGGFLIRDVAGDLYHVDDPESLDERSRRLLWAFVE